MSNSLAKLHPELVSQWSDRDFPFNPDNITYGSNKRICWKGNCGDEWTATVKSRTIYNTALINACIAAKLISGY